MEISPELAAKILAFVHAADYRPCKPRQIAEGLGIDEDQYPEVRRTIKRLVQQGQLAYGGNHLVSRPNEPGAGIAKTITGHFRHAVGGFGFVRPTISPSETEIPEDLFIPPGQTLGALDDDLVEVQIQRGHDYRREGLEGSILKILQRARRQFTGTFQARSGGSGVAFLDGTPYDQPVAVGDVRGLPLENDDKIVVELVQFPDASGANGEGVILEVLGSSKNPAIDTISIMRQYGLPDAFPQTVIESAREQADRHDFAAIGDRRDLTDLLTLTIDPEDARDFDDAISLVQEKGRWTLWVHIADVTHFVPAGSPLDHEARDRATSVYLPDRVVPMLPEIISNHLASLQPDQVRFAKTVEMEFLENGTITSTEVYNSVIRSSKRLNYDLVDAFLKDPPQYTQLWGEAIGGLLGRMHRLAMMLRRRRLAHGALTMEMPDIKLKLDKLGKVKGAYVVHHTESHQIIEEFMLVANESVATWLSDQRLNFLRRIHPAPDRRKLRQLSRFVNDLGLPVGDLESRFQIQSILDAVAGKPLENAVNFAVLKAMNKAIYAPHEEGHYALDMEHYCHFTSPIRRYPDLTVHRLVQKILDGVRTPDDPFPVLLQLGHHCSDKERNAEQAERELIQLKLLHHLNKKIGETMEAVISRVYPDGFYARCRDLPVDGFVPVTTLPTDKYRFERRGQMIVGFREGNQFRLGDALTVRVVKVDLRDRQLFLEVVKRHPTKNPLGLETKTGGPKRPKSKPSTKTPARQRKMRRRKMR